MKNSERQPASGAALVITVIVVAVLAVVTVAFMQTSGTDRLSSRTVADYYRAQLAAEAGLADAIHRVFVAVGTNKNFIVTETNHANGFAPVLLMGLRDATQTTNMYPIISGDLTAFNSVPSNASALTSCLAARTNVASSISVDVNLGRLSIIQPTNTMSPASISNWYRAPWMLTNVVVTNPLGIKTTNLFRYSFWVADEQARLNPLVHHGLTGGARTNYGRNASEIRIGSTNLPLVAGASALASITNNATNIATADTLALILGSNYMTNRHLVSVQSVVGEDIIPAGYLTTNAGVTNFVKYADAGKPKYNINDLATNTAYGATPENRAKFIGGIISSNLTNFFERDAGSKLAGLTNTLYANRITSGIVDYIDNDTVPTSGNNGEPAGKELAPYVVMVAERNTWASETGASPPYIVTIRSEFFVQLWNPYTVSVSGNVALSLTNRQYIEIPNGGVNTDLEAYSSDDMVATLQPNEMKSFSLGSTEQSFFTSSLPTTPKPSAAPENYPRWPTTSSGSSSLTGHPQFKLRWNGALLDMNRQEPEMNPPAASGLVRQSPGDNFGPRGAMRWSFNFCAPNTPNTVGDPRANFISESDWAGLANIASARWHGRQMDTGGRQQNFSQLWSLRDYVRADLPQGTALASVDEDPVAIATTYTPANGADAPLFFRNGQMLSISELGNIFDAAQAGDSGTSTAGTTQGFFRPGGGRSLRIGQDESPYWNEPGKRAMQLLDLFTVNSLGTNTAQLGSIAYTNSPIMIGRINVNTAPKPVLASVFEGVAINSDQGITAATNIAGNIADAIITNRPYSRISDLHKALGAFANGTNYSPPIANVSVTVSNALAGTSTNYTAMAAMDRAREELFARTVNLLTTQSRAFRVYAVGETLDKQSNAVSRAALEAVVRLEPTTNADRLIPKIIYRKFQ